MGCVFMNIRACLYALDLCKLIVSEFVFFKYNFNFCPMILLSRQSYFLVRMWLCLSCDCTVCCIHEGEFAQLPSAYHTRLNLLSCTFCPTVPLSGPLQLPLYSAGIPSQNDGSYEMKNANYIQLSY